MKATSQPNPTPSELEILQVLWSRGPSTVREVYEVVSVTKQLGYTSVLKLMQIMTAKGLVTRSEDQRAHVYVCGLGLLKRKHDVKPEKHNRVSQGLQHLQAQYSFSAPEASATQVEQHEREHRCHH